MINVALKERLLAQEKFIGSNLGKKIGYKNKLIERTMYKQTKACK